MAGSGDRIHEVEVLLAETNKRVAALEVKAEEWHPTWEETVRLAIYEWRKDDMQQLSELQRRLDETENKLKFTRDELNLMRGQLRLLRAGSTVR